MEPCLLVTKSSPPSGGAQKKKKEEDVGNNVRWDVILIFACARARVPESNPTTYVWQPHCLLPGSCLGRSMLRAFGTPRDDPRDPLSYEHY